jgi:hypothetical protein
VSDKTACEPLPRALKISSDVAFAAAASDLTLWSPPLLDVYAPEDAQGLPLVIMLPPHNIGAIGRGELGVAADG